MLEGDLFLLHGIHVHLNDGKVGPVIVPHQLGGDPLLVRERHVNFRGTACHVKVGQNMTFVINDHPRPNAALQLSLAFGVDLLLHVQANHRRKYFLGDRQPGLRRGAGKWLIFRSGTGPFCETDRREGEAQKKGIYAPARGLRHQRELAF